MWTTTPRHKAAAVAGGPSPVPSLHLSVGALKGRSHMPIAERVVVKPPDGDSRTLGLAADLRARDVDGACKTSSSSELACCTPHTNSGTSTNTGDGGHLDSPTIASPMGTPTPRSQASFNSFVRTDSAVCRRAGSSSPHSSSTTGGFDFSIANHKESSISASDAAESQGSRLDHNISDASEAVRKTIGIVGDAKAASLVPELRSQCGAGPPAGGEGIRSGNMLRRAQPLLRIRSLNESPQQINRAEGVSRSCATSRPSGSQSQHMLTQQVGLRQLQLARGGSCAPAGAPGDYEGDRHVDVSQAHVRVSQKANDPKTLRTSIRACREGSCCSGTEQAPRVSMVSPLSPMATPRSSIGSLLGNLMDAPMPGQTHADHARHLPSAVVYSPQRRFREARTSDPRSEGAAAVPSTYADVRGMPDLQNGPSAQPAVTWTLKGAAAAMYTPREVRSVGNEEVVRNMRNGPGCAPPQQKARRSSTGHCSPMPTVCDRSCLRITRSRSASEQLRGAYTPTSETAMSRHHALLCQIKRGEALILEARGRSCDRTPSTTTVIANSPLRCSAREVF